MRTVIYNQKEKRRLYPRLDCRAAELLDESLDGRGSHIALRTEADHSPRTEFRTSTNFLTNQVPNPVLGCQQALLFGGLVVLNLRSREDTSVDDRRLGLDLQPPAEEILHVR